MLSSTAGQFVVISPHTNNPSFYWKGEQLMYVVEAKTELNEDGGYTKIKVYDPNNEQSAIYHEMRSAGIVVKRVRA